MDWLQRHEINDIFRPSFQVRHSPSKTGVLLVANKNMFKSTIYDIIQNVLSFM